jgi:tetratricopeptide (TPR) repeat protein
MLGLANRLGHRELKFLCYAVQVANVLEVGDIETAKQGIAAYGRLAETLRQPHYLWWLTGFRAMLALLVGRLDEAERLAGEALAIGQERPLDAAQVFGVHQFTIRRERGGLEELAVLTEQLSEQHRTIPAWRCGFALLLAELGRTAEAQRELDDLAAGEFRAVRRDIAWLVSMSLLAETAAVLRDLPRAAALSELLRPYGERVVVVGYGYACWGALSRHLGLLATTLSRWEEAAEHLQNALQVNERLGARLCLARTQVDYAEMLLRRGDPGDREQAHALIGAALAIGRECGMHRLLEHAQRLQGDAEASPHRSAAARQGVFKLDGDYWTVAYGELVLRLKDMKGLRYIHHLLRHPAVEVHVLDLAGVTERRPEGPRRGRERTLGVTHDSAAGAVLDARARAEYKRRLRDLEDELQEAEAHNDLGRTERTRFEIDCLTQQLAAASGLGRTRRAGSYAERARVNVTKLIGTAIRRIATNDAALGRYLANSIRTGTFCSYTPDPNQPVAWQLSS